MARGQAVKRDSIASTDSKKASEVDTLSPIDKGKDFVKTGETA